MEDLKKLEEKLLDKKENGWEKTTNIEREKIFSFAENYKDFLSNKTERECVKSIISKLEKSNFKNIEEVKEIKQGDQVYYVNRNKSLYIAKIGEEKPSKGFNMIGAHLDSPRLDLKPNPLYEDTELALFKTHYYGGIKKYQWVNIPLSMHGIIIKENNEKLEINIGEEETDPIFTIADLLPHLSSKQEKKTLKDGIEAEDLNIVIGSIPIEGDTKNKIKLNILKLLNEKYGITEKDFTSAEIEFTPAMKPKDLGFDRSLIAAYGQDDRVCSYTSLEALLKSNPKRTSICILADKEEIGSMGNTGMYSHTFEYFIDILLEKLGENKVGKRTEVFNNSKLLSADVTGAYNPNYPDIYEKNNESYLNYGVSINKYTGSASKGGASDANAEYVAYIRNLFTSNNITYQVSEMGKIGIGGGGTIAYILADRGMDVIDCGVPVMSMHSPYEITSKFDIYNAYKAYKVFYEDD